MKRKRLSKLARDKANGHSLYWRNKLIALWSGAIRSRAGYKCERCGDTKRTNAAHLIPKRVWFLRFDLRNGICLCPKCHQWDVMGSLDYSGMLFAQWLFHASESTWNNVRTMWVEMAYVESKLSTPKRPDWRAIYDKLMEAKSS